jgi:hypothetical protein
MNAISSTLCSLGIIPLIDVMILTLNCTTLPRTLMLALCYVTRRSISAVLKFFMILIGMDVLAIPYRAAFPLEIIRFRKWAHLRTFQM